MSCTILVIHLVLYKVFLVSLILHCTPVVVGILILNETFKGLVSSGQVIALCGAYILEWALNWSFLWYLSLVLIQVHQA